MAILFEQSRVPLHAQMKNVKKGYKGLESLENHAMIKGKENKR